MNTQSLSPSLFLPQSVLTETDIGNSSHSHHRGVEEEQNHSFQNKLNDDSYHPSERIGSGLASTEMSVQGVATSISHSAEIQVTTQQGDVVTISLNQSAQSSRSVFQAEQGKTNVSAYSESYSYESGFSMSVEGDLNEDEQKSLSDLINKMSKVSDKFFKGNVESAFKHALKVGFDTEQIAGFSMDLSREKSVQAVSAYQQTIVPEHNINTDLLKQAGDFLAQTKVFLAESGAMLESLAEPKQAFTDLFAGVGQMNNVIPEQVDDASKPLFLKMIENITHDIFDD